MNSRGHGGAALLMGVAAALSAPSAATAQTFIGLGIPPGWMASHAFGVSADGSAVVVYAADASGQRHAFRWTRASGPVNIGAIDGGGDSGGFGINCDGSVVFGSAGSQVFQWSSCGGMADLGDLAGRNFWRACLPRATRMGPRRSAPVGTLGTDGRRCLAWSISAHSPAALGYRRWP